MMHYILIGLIVICCLLYSIHVGKDCLLLPLNPREHAHLALALAAWHPPSLRSIVDSCSVHKMAGPKSYRAQGGTLEVGRDRRFERKVAGRDRLVELLPFPPSTASEAPRMRRYGRKIDHVPGKRDWLMGNTAVEWSPRPT